MDRPIELLRHFAEVGHSLDRAQTRQLFSMVQAARQLLKTRLLELLQDHASSPVLLQYSGDCTPVHVRQHGTAGLPGKRRKISGPLAVEFYVHQVFATIGLGDGRRQHSLLLGDPMALRHGKSMAALISVALTCPGLKIPDSQRRIVIFHQVHDRGISASFRNALSGAWVTSMQATMPPSSSASGSATPSATTSNSLFYWHTSLGCSCHDGHNALRWAAQVADDASETVKNVYIALSLYRKGFMAAAAALGEWLCQVVEATPTGRLPPRDALKQLYQTLGAADDALEMLVRSSVHWDFAAERLVVDADFLAAPDSISLLSSLLLDVWRFPSFSMSRWVTLGCSVRIFTLAYFTGYTHLFDHMRRQGVLTEFEVGGVAKMQQRELRWCLSVGLAATLPDAFLQRLLADSRLSMHRHAVALEVQAAFDFLEQLPAEAWRLLAAPYSLAAAELRDAAIKASWTALAYLEWRVFAVLGSPPWNFLEDGPEQAVKSLEGLSSPPEEQVCHKAWQLLHLGHPTKDVQQALGLLHATSWTSAFTEKQHASTAVVKKFHQGGSYEVTSARAYVHTFRSSHSMHVHPPHGRGARQ